MGRVMDERAGAGKGRFLRQTRNEYLAVFKRQIVEDRTVRPIVSVAGADELGEGLRHRLHFGDALLEVADVRLGDAFHVAAGTAAIAPQGQERGDFRNGKPEPARPPDETELVDVALAVVSVGVAAALRGRNRPIAS